MRSHGDVKENPCWMKLGQEGLSPAFRGTSGGRFPLVEDAVACISSGRRLCSVWTTTLPGCKAHGRAQYSSPTTARTLFLAASIAATDVSAVL